jgi:type I restriction enzyme M protein
VLKKCKKFDDVLFINAAEHFEKSKRQNRLRDGEGNQPNDIRKIVDTYKYRPDKIERYARCVSMEEIEKNDFNLNISRYVSTSIEEEKVDLPKVNKTLVDIEKKIADSRNTYNQFLKELGLPPI